MLGLILDVARSSEMAAVIQGIAGGLSAGALYVADNRKEADQYNTRSIRFFPSLRATLRGPYSRAAFLTPIATAAARHAILAGNGLEGVGEMAVNAVLDAGYSYATLPVTALLGYGMTWFAGRGIGYFSPAFRPVFWGLAQFAVLSMGIALFDHLRF